MLSQIQLVLELQDLKQDTVWLLTMTIRQSVFKDLNERLGSWES